MKSGERIIHLAWFFLGLMAVGAAIILLSRPSLNELPLSTSFDPGGASALAELLRQEGYTVEVLDSIPIDPEKDVLPIAFLDRDQITLDPDSKPKTDSDSKSPKKSDTPSEEFVSPLEPDPTLKFITSQMRAGDPALVLGYDEAKDVTTLVPISSKVVDEYGHAYSVTAFSGLPANGLNLQAADATYDAWTFQDKSAFADIDSSNGGKVVVIPEGEVALNTFIDRQDNAKFIFDTVRLLTPPSKKIQIIDGSVLGAGEVGLVDILGPWAHGIEVQLIILGLVIFYTLGKRFGIADETPRVQPGARDLLNAIADTYARGRAGKAALQSLTQDADRSVRRYLKLASDASIRKRNEMLPSSVAQALTACEHAIMQDPRPDEALELVRRLETELEVFLSRRRISANRRRRRVKSA